MARFRQKPIEIEAWRVGSDEPKPDWLHEAWLNAILFGNGADYYDIRSRAVTLRAERGDWVVRGIDGELRPCKPDVFTASFKPIR